MPKNKGKGGKKNKKGKNKKKDHESGHRSLRFAQFYERYALVKRPLGHCRFRLNVYTYNSVIDGKRENDPIEDNSQDNSQDKDKDKDTENNDIENIDGVTVGSYECIGILRHNKRRLYKRCHISTDDIILVSLRDFQKDIVDIVYAYNSDEVDRLRKCGELRDNTSNLNSNQTNCIDFEKDIQFDNDIINDMVDDDDDDMGIDELNIL